MLLKCKYALCYIWSWDWLIWSEHGADNAKFASIIPLRTIYLRAEFDDPYGSFSTVIFAQMSQVTIGQKKLNLHTYSSKLNENL